MSIFDQEDTNQFDQNKNYLEELVGEGKKFKTVEDLARGKAEADHFITHKNKEFDELREDALKWRAEATAQAKFQELVTKLENKGTTNEPAITPAANVEQPILDQKKIEDIISIRLQEIEARKNEKSNLDKVDQRLRERFGDNARSILKDKMNTLGMTDEDLKFLAKRSPEAALNAIGVNQQQTENFQSPPRSSLRSDNFSPQSELRDAVYYEKLRKTDPKKYFDPKISTQRLKDMEHPEFLTRHQSRL